uniref:NADH-ubiquinone oxidoreductase chain 5 n=1 Tax=Idiostolus sp. TaxID=2931296 RepID=A0A8T9ZZQ0_9HEMI|nr:NADH dehydrogenase subunit 5 [Idiostolus sp.]
MNKLNMYIYWSLIIFLNGLMLFILGLYLIMSDKIIIMDWEILSLNSSMIVMTLIIDYMSIIFMSCVLLISSMVIFYSYSYMSLDMNNLRFLYLVLLFIFSMMSMIMSPNMISILLGWDGLGLVSYCLVIYFQNTKSYNAGMLTILTNRLGDVAILLSISWMFNMGDWNFYYHFYSYNWIQFLFILVILAGFTKSAQIPFSSWLPAAMAAPTPVSALVHSSTLVTAGVYLFIRFSNLLYNFDLSLVLLISILTMFMSGLGANFEYDLKKIIALSTLSQLGLMMSIIFLGFPTLAFFHLLTHAFFKALLFLCAGLIIHCMNDSQDIRYMGSLSSPLPFTMICFCISNLSLCGFPFLSGFYSKDLILETLTLNDSNMFVYLIFYISVGLTVSYSMRLIYFCIMSSSGLTSCQSFYEDKVMMFSMILLTLFAVFSGSLLMWIMFPFPSVLLLPIECKLLPLIFIIMGGWLGYELSYLTLNDNMFNVLNNMSVVFFGSMWFMPYFSTVSMSYSMFFLSNNYYKFMDMGWGEYVMSNVLINYFNYLSKYNIIYQNNNIKILLMIFVLTFIFLILVI